MNSVRLNITLHCKHVSFHIVRKNIKISTIYAQTHFSTEIRGDKWLGKWWQKKVHKKHFKNSYNYTLTASYLT